MKEIAITLASLLAGALFTGCATRSASSLTFGGKSAASDSTPDTNWVSRAEWIGLDAAEAGKKPRYLRRDFDVGKISRAVLRVTAQGAVAPFLNGEKVADEYFAPGWSNYRKRLYYREYDVTDRIREGANTVGAILGDGWFRGRVGTGRTNAYGKRTRLKLELVAYPKNGEPVRIATDASWTVATGPILSGDFQDGETYDARLEEPGWCLPSCPTNSWRAVDVGHPDFEPTLVEPHPCGPVVVVAELPARSVAEPKPGVYVFDLGQNFAGIARLRVKAPAGTEVKLRFAEMLNADGTIYTANLRGVRATDTYVCKGGDVEEWSPLFTFHGFRYVELTGFPGKPGADAVTGLALSTRMRRAGTFECSNPLVNQIYSNAWWSQLSNYIDVPTDCPQRNERLGWTGDAQVFARTALYNTDAAAFLGKYVDALNDDQSGDGHYPDVAPTVMCGGSSPAWGDAGVFIPWEIFRLTGDLGPARRNWRKMKRYMDFLDRSAPEGAGPHRGYGDWLACGPQPSKSLIFTAYNAQDCEIMRNLADALAKVAEGADEREAFKADSRRFAEKTKTLRDVFGKTFCSPTNDATVAGDAQTGYLLRLGFTALHDGVTDARHAARLAKIVGERPQQMCGFVGVNLFLPVLSQIGRDDLAYRRLERTDYPGWGYSVAQGATTIWERWNSYMKGGKFGDANMNSFNHYAYGSCVQWFYEGILGITPGAVGKPDAHPFSIVSIAPHPGGTLTWAKGSHECALGRIAVDWKIVAGEFLLTVELPKGVRGEIRLPGQTTVKVQTARKATYRYPAPN